MEAAYRAALFIPAPVSLEPEAVRVLTARADPVYLILIFLVAIHDRPEPSSARTAIVRSPGAR